MDVQMRFIAVDNVQGLPLSGSHLGHRLFRKLNRLLGSELIRLMFRITWEKTHNRMNKIILRRLFPDTLLGSK